MVCTATPAPTPAGAIILEGAKGIHSKGQYTFALHQGTLGTSAVVFRGLDNCLASKVNAWKVSQQNISHARASRILHVYI
jgi:hypothetical protein